MEQITEKLNDFKKRVENGNLPEVISREMKLGPSNVVLRLLRKQIGNEKFTEWMHEFVMPLKFREWLKVYVKYVNTSDKLNTIEMIFNEYIESKRDELNG